MALPTSAYVEVRGRQTPHGIVVAIYPSTVSGLYCELQTATANSTLSSKWNSHILAPTSVGEWQYPLNVPPSTKPVYVRARYPAQPGYSAGPFTPVVNARPSKVASVLRKFPVLMTGAGNVEVPARSDVFISSGQTVKVGTQVTTATIGKVLYISAAQFTPRTSTMFRKFTAGYLEIAHADTTKSQDYRTAVILSTGIVITGIGIRSQKAGSTSATIQAILARTKSSDGSVDNIKTITHATSGTNWVTTTGATTGTQTVSSSRFYFLQLVMQAAPGGIATVRLTQVKVGYTMPDYKKGV